ncbi:MAG TPA: hypothetical protein VEJ47_21580 [Candidatus Eremiobacteraceae bacterium]|nr:hypothetical protein [Candidatus Eremiobacteraceae bacterium]
MAGIAHAAVGLAAKPLIPEVNVGWLILGTFVLDILYFAFLAVGLEVWPANPAAHPPWWDHSLLMAVVWSLLFGLLASWLGRRSHYRTRIGAVFGLLVFSHWVLDWITHPMTALAASDKGIPLAFGNSPLVGLGLYRSITAVWVTEIGATLVGLAIYIVWRMRRKKAERAA